MRPVSLWLALLLALLTPGLARAQDYATLFGRAAVCTPAQGAEAMYISWVIPLVPYTSERPRTRKNFVVRNQVSLTFEEGMELTIGGPNGRPYWTKDVFSVTALPAQKTWRHDFRRNGLPVVDQLSEPYTITHMLTPGLNVLQVAAESLSGLSVDTGVYVLTVWQPCTPRSGAAPSALQAGSSLAAAPPPAAAPAVTATRPVPTATAAPPTAHTALGAAIDAAEPLSSGQALTRWLAPLFWMALPLWLLLGIALARRSRRAVKT